jgi:hypothetical protein
MSASHPMTSEGETTMTRSAGFENRCEKTLNEGRHVCLLAANHDGECRAMVNAPWPAMTTEGEAREALKSCPFCGGAAMIEQCGEGWRVECRADDCEIDPDTGYLRIVDKETLATVPRSRADAIAAWNRRSVPGEQAGETRIRCDAIHRFARWADQDDTNESVSAKARTFLVVSGFARGDAPVEPPTGGAGDAQIVADALGYLINVVRASDRWTHECENANKRAAAAIADLAVRDARSSSGTPDTLSPDERGIVAYARQAWADYPEGVVPRLLAIIARLSGGNGHG